MLSQTHKIWEPEEYHYKIHGNFIPNIVSYIHERQDHVRPAVIVVPGGGYNVVSPSEGEVVAMEFYNRGFNTFVLTYTTNPFNETPLGLQPLKDLSKAIVYIRNESIGFNIDPNKITICGFSAGAHLTGSLAVHYENYNLELDGKYKGISNRPDAIILSYPVITTGQYSHHNSFRALFGENMTQEQLDFMSLEKHVSSMTPPSFIWHTATDELVPVENSYLFAMSCQNNKIPYELHVFGNGKHGLSLANEKWINAPIESDYTMLQLYEEIKYRLKYNIELPESIEKLISQNENGDIIESFRNILDFKNKGNKTDSGIAMWFELVQIWLGKVIDI